jgi:AcrR family transcriptional regulator
MAKRARTANRAVQTPPRGRRLTAEARKKSILQAARRAFSENGDVNGTTIKVIAEHGGISEGVIYRHFESKEQLFFEAVVEPLQDAVDKLVVAARQIDRDEPLSRERQLETTKGLYRQLLSTMDEVLPLLGLVLFGDPQVARKFYKDTFAAAMDRLAEAWREVEHRYGIDESLDISARAVMGTALMMALESHYTRGFDRDRAINLAAEGTIKGFFAPVTAERRRR